MLIGIDASRAFLPNRTGTENYSYQLIRALTEIDRYNQYHLYTRFPVSQPSLDFALPENFIIVNIDRKKLWTQVGLAREVFFHPPDVLFIPAHTLPLIRRPGLKTVVTIHDLGYEFLPQYHQFPHKLYLNKSTEYAVKFANRLIAVSKATRTDLIQKLNCPKDKITVVYESFDQDRYYPLPEKKISKTLKKLQIDKPYILFVGTIQPRKNITRLIEAFSLLSDKFPRLTLIIAGNKGWMYDEIFAAPKKLGIEKRVKFIGYTTENDLLELYNHAACFCLPSLFEGFGLPLLEAMACGCPVIASRISSMPEVVGGAGLLVDPYNTKDIAIKIEQMIENDVLRSGLKKRALLQAKKFSWEKTANETLEVLKQTFNG